MRTMGRRGLGESRPAGRVGVLHVGRHSGAMARRGHGRRRPGAKGSSGAQHPAVRQPRSPEWPDACGQCCYRGTSRCAPRVCRPGRRAGGSPSRARLPLWADSTLVHGPLSPKPSVSTLCTGGGAMGMPGRRRAAAGPHAPLLQGITAQRPAKMRQRVSQNRETAGLLLRFERAGPVVPRTYAGQASCPCRNAVASNLGRRTRRGVRSPPIACQRQLQCALLGRPGCRPKRGQLVGTVVHNRRSLSGLHT
jgi:hypothetical protein